MSEAVIVYSADPVTGAYQGPVEVVEGLYPISYSQTPPGDPVADHTWFLVNGAWESHLPVQVFHEADYLSGLYLKTVEVHFPDPLPGCGSLIAPPEVPEGHLPILKEGAWTLVPLPPITPIGEFPVLPVVVTNVNLPIEDGMHDGFNDQIIDIVGLLPHLPEGSMTIIVQELVANKAVLKEYRFVAQIEEIPDNVFRRFVLRIRFATSGNYLITQERLNEGLEQVGKPIRIALNKLEFNIRDAI